MQRFRKARKSYSAQSCVGQNHNITSFYKQFCTLELSPVQLCGWVVDVSCGECTCVCTLSVQRTHTGAYLQYLVHVLHVVLFIILHHKTVCHVPVLVHQQPSEKPAKALDTSTAVRGVHQQWGLKHSF